MNRWAIFFRPEGFQSHEESANGVGWHWHWKHKWQAVSRARRGHAEHGRVAPVVEAGVLCQRQMPGLGATGGRFGRPCSAHRRRKGTGGPKLPPVPARRDRTAILNLACDKARVAGRVEREWLARPSRDVIPRAKNTPPRGGLIGIDRNRSVG